MSAAMFHFDRDTFSTLFPFYMVVDRHGMLRHFGPSLHKMLPELQEHTLFETYFQFKNPIIPQGKAIDFEKLTDALLVIHVITQTRTFLRGQFLKHHEEYLFVGSPWVSNIEELHEKKLDIADFAYHDSSVDMLNMLRSLEISNSDLKYMVHAISGQKKELQRDKEEIKKLSLVVSTNENGVVLSDLHGEIFWVNPSYLQMTGYTEEEVLGKTMYDLGVMEQTDKNTLQQMMIAFRKAEWFDCEVQHKHRDGGAFWARIKGQPVFDQLGKFIEYYTIIEDITPKKEMEDRLRESEQRLRTLILNLHDGVLLEDENRHILLVNQKFCTMFGIPVDPEHLIGADCSNSAQESKSHFKDPEGFVQRIEEILAQKETVIHEALELKGGRFFARSYIPIVIDKVHKGHLWAYQDITLERNFQENLNYEKEKYRRIIENMNIGLLEVDNEDNILLTNQRFCAMSGYTPEELIGKKGVDVFLNEETRRLLSEKSELRKSKIADSYELEVTDSNGVDRVWLVSGGPNYDIKGAVIGSIGLHFDITETRNLERLREELLAKLEQQNRQLNEYAQIVSHDLKSPLRSIHSLITFIKEDNDQAFNSVTAQYFQLIQEKVEKMERLIQGILSYSRIDHTQYKTERLNLNQLVQTVTSIIEVPPHITIRVKRELPTLKGDAYRLQQVFLNLMTNAILYNDKAEGWVEIDFQEEPHQYTFSIRDNGKGIHEKDVKRIFKMFESLNPNDRSTGIGLTIVKKILDDMQESIYLESEPGIGSVFYFTLQKNGRRTT